MAQANDIWVLEDDRMGNTTQSLGCAYALDLPFTIKKINYTKWARLPNIIKGKSLLGITDDSKSGIMAPFPKLVIAAGRKLACVSRYIKKHSPQTKLVHIMNPGFIGFSDFDIVALPIHDKVLLNHKNILRIATSAHTITNQKLLQAQDQWQEKLANYPSPFTSVFIGGSTKNKTFTTEMAQELGEILASISEKHKGTLLVTTSRRTGPYQEDILKKLIPQPCYFYSWNDGSDNPYFAFMANANNIIATGDSISMISESLSPSVPVYIYNPLGLTGKKHNRFIDILYTENLALPLTKSTELQFKSKYSPKNMLKNSAIAITQEIKKILAI